MVSAALPPRFKLFVSGPVEYVGLRLERLSQGLSTVCGRPILLERIDVQTEPQQAQAFGVVVTPVLIRVSPGPERRVFGDLHGPLGILAPAPSEPGGLGESGVVPAAAPCDLQSSRQYE